MIYHVRARFRDATAGDADQTPDGREIVAAMGRAVVAADGTVEWSETCFCTPPLAHERATVLDRHFEDITAEPIETHRSFAGEPFMDYLRARA